MEKDQVIIWDWNKIKAARVEAGFTAEIAASFIEITPEFLSMLENGKRQPSPRTITKMSSLYRRQLDYFLKSEKNLALG